MKPSEILDGAAALCERGWCQGTYQRRKAYCGSAALNKVTGGRVESYVSSWHPVWRYLGQVIPFALNYSQNGSLQLWNDTPGRTQSEVVAKLHEAAELARSEGQ